MSDLILIKPRSPIKVVVKYNEEFDWHEFIESRGSKQVHTHIVINKDKDKWVRYYGSLGWKELKE